MKSKNIAIPTPAKLEISPIVLRFEKEADVPSSFDKIEPGDKVCATIYATVSGKYEKKGKAYEGDSSYQARIELKDFDIEVEPMKKKGAKSISEAMEEVESKRKM